MFRTLAITAACLLGTVSAPAIAQQGKPVEYTVRKGDTLIEIARSYLTDQAAIAQVQRINGIKNPRAIPIGKRLRIPRALLRFEKVELKVSRFSGGVLRNGQPVSDADVLNVDDVVTTRPDGFVTFPSTGFGGRVSLPSNSVARWLRARRYVLGDTLEVDFQIDKGRGSITSPKLKGQDSLLIRTPRAVTAVRGTEFRVAFDPEGDRTITEVTEGAVAVASGSQEVAASAGFGIAGGADGLAEPEALLPAPEITDPSAIQTGETVKFSVKPDANARAYRVQIARDGGFLDIVRGAVTDTGEVEFTDLPNRNYFVRARSISAAGVEGFSSEIASTFRRKRLGVSAEAGASDLVDGYLFQWLGEGEGDVTYSFQFWPLGKPDQLVVDEAGLTDTAVVLTDLEAGAYEWRVAVVQPDSEDGLLKVWGPSQKMSIAN